MSSDLYVKVGGWGVRWGWGEYNGAIGGLEERV